MSFKYEVVRYPALNPNGQGVPTDTPQDLAARLSDLGAQGFRLVDTFSTKVSSYMVMELEIDEGA